MLKTQLLHSKMHAQNTALTLKYAVLQAQLVYSKMLCSEHSSHTPKCCAQNTAVTPQTETFCVENTLQEQVEVESPGSSSVDVRRRKVSVFARPSEEQMSRRPSTEIQPVITVARTRYKRFSVPTAPQLEEKTRRHSVSTVSRPNVSEGTDFVNSLSVPEGIDFVDSLFRDLARFVIFWCIVQIKFWQLIMHRTAWLMSHT